MEPSSIRAMAMRILFLKKMKRHRVTRKMMPETEVKAIQVSLCLRKSSTISGVQLSWKIILLIYELNYF